jgi:translocation and assembly module TamB
VEAPRAVFIRGRGVEAELGGSLAIAGTVAEPAVQGVLTLRRGQVEVLDRRLAFERGGLRFEGDPTEPQIDLLATTNVSGTTIRVSVEGTPREPQIVFSSSPELPQDEVLARLLFNRPTGNLSPFQVAQLANALAGAAGITEGGGILDRIRRRLGLDRLGVGSDHNAEGRETPSLEAGSYVADGVYVGVRQGAQAGAPRVGVEIDLLPRLKLQAETGSGEGERSGNRLGLSYELEY